MVRFNMYESCIPFVYGTATRKDIFTVCCAAMAYCLVTGAAVLGFVTALI